VEYTLTVTREQAVAAGLDPDRPIKILEGRDVTVVLADGLTAGNSRKASRDGSDDLMVSPHAAHLYQWANANRLLISALD
jgi:hypothetical protein